MSKKGEDRSTDSTDTTDGTGDDTPATRDLTEQGLNLSASEEAALRRVQSVSRLLDEAFRIPGTEYRIGIDPVIGVLPGAGDAVTTAISLYPILEAYRLGVPRGTLAKMLALVAVDAVVGSLPVIGTVFDAVWKANKWNLRTVERHIRQG